MESGVADASLARAAESLGMGTAALRAWQICLDRQPDNAEPLSAMAALYEERGEDARAEACRRRSALPFCGPMWRARLRWVSIF